MSNYPAVPPSPNSDPDAVAFVRVCRFCSTQAKTSSQICPACGKSYIRKQVSKRTKVVAAAVVAALAVGGLGTLLMKRHHDHVRAEAAAIAASKAKRAAEKAKADAAKAAADAAAAQAAKDDEQRAVRKSAVKEMQKSITNDAKNKVTQGILDGPILYTSCDPLGGGSTDDLTAITTTFSCLAVNKENADNTVSGYSFSATMNWTEGSYTWQLGS